MRVRLSRAADRDLESIGDWIARDDPRAAVRFVARLHAKALSLGSNPRLYPVIGRLGPQQVRRANMRPYAILYVVGARIDILRIVHGAVDLTRILDPE